MIAWNTDTLYTLTVTLANGYEAKWVSPQGDNNV